MSEGDIHWELGLEDSLQQFVLRSHAAPDRFGRTSNCDEREKPRGGRCLPVTPGACRVPAALSASVTVVMLDTGDEEVVQLRLGVSWLLSSGPVSVQQCCGRRQRRCAKHPRLRVRGVGSSPALAFDPVVWERVCPTQPWRFLS